MTLNVLIACECSQTVCMEFRKLGANAFSCDIEPPYGGHPEWHILADVELVLCPPLTVITCDATRHHIKSWDLVIAHPPCTYLCRAQNGLYNRKRLGDAYVDARIQKREEAIKFFKRFTQLGVPPAIENPPGYMNSHYRKPDQNIEPYLFGDSATKKTSLWLFGLPTLTPTCIVDPPPRPFFPNSNPMGGWYFDTSKLPHKERSRARSKTFPGIAKAMAHQWLKFLSVFAISLLITNITTGIAEGAPKCTEWAAAQIEAKADRYAQYKADAADNLDTVTAILADEGLPPRWAYLMLVESGGDSQAKSAKGAAGLWQLTAATARAYGCTSRTDTETSTRAAARYITHLLAKFDGDEWKAIAAFNMGGTNLIKRGPTREARALADLVTCLFYKDPFFLDSME